MHSDSCAEASLRKVRFRFPSIGHRLHASQSEVLTDFHVTERSLQQAEEWWNKEALVGQYTSLGGASQALL